MKAYLTNQGTPTIIKKQGLLNNSELYKSMDQIHEKKMIKAVLAALAKKLVMTPESDPEAAAAEDQADMARNKKRDEKKPKPTIKTGPRGL